MTCLIKYKYEYEGIKDFMTYNVFDEDCIRTVIRSFDKSSWRKARSCKICYRFFPILSRSYCPCNSTESKTYMKRKINKHIKIFERINGL